MGEKDPLHVSLAGVVENQVANHNSGLFTNPHDCATIALNLMTLIEQIVSGAQTGGDRAAQAGSVICRRVHRIYSCGIGAPAGTEVPEAAFSV